MAAEPTTLTNGTGTSNPATTASVFPTSGRLLELDVIVAAETPETITDDDLSVEGLSATWAFVKFQAYGQRRAIWRFRCESAGISGELGLEYTGPGFAELGWALKEWSGQVQGSNGAGAVGTPVSDDREFGTTLTLGTVGTLATGDAASTVFGIESDDGAGVITGYTELVDQSGTNANIRQMLVGWDDTDVTAGATWTGNSDAGGIANRIIAGSDGVTGTIVVTEEDDVTVGYLLMRTPKAQVHWLVLYTGSNGVGIVQLLGGNLVSDDGSTLVFHDQGGDLVTVPAGYYLAYVDNLGVNQGWYDIDNVVPPELLHQWYRSIM